jgi:hypothetical protein
MRRIMLLVWMMVAMALVGTTAFGQTVLTDVWKDKDRPGAVKKIAVFWNARVPQNRLLAENEFVRQLKARSLVAMPVYVVIPPDKLVERDAALMKIRELGADAVLTLRIIDKETAQSRISDPGPTVPSRLSDYYQNVYDAPVRDESDLAYLETNLFEVNSGRRIWTARSVTKVGVVDQKAL